MLRRLTTVSLLAMLLIAGVACKNKNVNNPLAEVDSKQPDKVLFDRAMGAMKSRKYDVARLTLQTLINTYPDSEYVARAKLAVGDSWYAEGGSAAFAQAESEYKDFITFFPNMPEASEAQMRVADIHYRQMEKPDRDYTHAKRAEEEYRNMLLQYPDSPLTDKARLKLLEVQEVLAEREYRIGRFYFLRESWPAAIARLKSVTDAYPLFSRADEALYMLGRSYETQAELIRGSRLNDVAKNRLIREYEDSAAVAYSKIVTRYPVTPRFEDAKTRLAALDRPVPKPTEEAIALNRKEVESRGQQTRMGRVMGNFKKAPEGSLVAATKVGQPTLVEPKQSDAAQIVRKMSETITGSNAAPSGKVTVETVKDGKVPDSQPVPRSDAAPAEQPAPPPEQVNEAAAPAAADEAAATGNTPQATPAENNASADKATADKNSSSSKKKKKTGLRRIVPF